MSEATEKRKGWYEEEEGTEEIEDELKEYIGSTSIRLAGTKIMEKPEGNAGYLTLHKILERHCLFFCTLKLMGMLKAICNSKDFFPP